MAAWNIVLSDSKAANDSDQQDQDAQAVLRIAEESGPNCCKGRNSFEADRPSRDGAHLNRRESEDRNGENEQPCDPAKEGLRCHGGAV